jgi:RNA polymerase sigma factor (sigma-70 family)
VVQVPLEFDPADLRSRRPDEESPEDPPLFLALREAVDHLPARQRQAVELRFWQGLSVRATARAMGIGVSTVAEHLQKARTNLARTLSALYQTCVPETGSDPNTSAF